MSYIEKDNNAQTTSISKTHILIDGLEYLSRIDPYVKRPFLSFENQESTPPPPPPPSCSANNKDACFRHRNTNKKKSQQYTALTDHELDRLDCLDPTFCYITQSPPSKYVRESGVTDPMRHI